MTERLNCSNCGAPVTRNGRESRVTCPHCQNVTDFGSSGSSSSSRDDDSDDDLDVDSSRHHSGSNEIPQIVIIQGGGPTIVRRTSYFPFLIGPIFFILISVGISIMHARAARNAASTVNNAEKAVEKAEHAAEKTEHAAEKPGEKKPAGHH